MSKFITAHINDCAACQARNGPKKRLTQNMKSQVAGYFNERLVIDLITLKPSSENHTRALSIVDVYSGYAEAHAMHSGTAAETVKTLFNHWVTKNGCPATILSDNGPEFASALSTEFFDKMDIKSIKSTPYSPQTCGKAEVWNKTIKNVLSKLMAKGDRDWHNMLHKIGFFYNASVNMTTKYTPFEL